MKLRMALSCFLGMALGAISLGLVAKADGLGEDDPRPFCPYYCGIYYSEGSAPYNTCVASCQHGAEVCRALSSSACLQCCADFCAGDTTCQGNCIHHARECYVSSE